ncbi:hypothetical protein WDU94_007192 [Cyamophila willieti]
MLKLMQVYKKINNFLIHIMTHNLHLISNMTNKSSPGFLPGIISRYEPGVHEMDISEFSRHLHTSPSSPGTEETTLLQSSNNPWGKLYGQTSLCTTHLYGTYLRINHPGYLLPNLTECKVEGSYYPHILKSIPPPSPPLFNSADDHVIRVTLTPSGTNYVESPGLVIYGMPGTGKSYAQSQSMYRHADTDYLYQTNYKVVNQLTSLGVIVFTNLYNLLIDKVPVIIMFLPTNKLMIDRIIKKTKHVNASIANQWVSDLEATVQDVRARADSIRRDNKCVILVRTNGSEYIADAIYGLSRRTS